MKIQEIGNTKKKIVLKWPKVAIIILNWNGWKDTVECLESVFRNNYPNYQVIVIDNGSTNDSMEKIKEWAEGKQEVLTPEPSHPLYHLSHPPLKKPIPYIYYTRGEAEEGGNISLEKKITKEWQKIKEANNKFNSASPYPLIFIQTGENLGFAGGNNVGVRYGLKNNKYDYFLLLNNDTVVEPAFLKELIKTAARNQNIGIIGGKILYYSKHNIIWDAGGKLNTIRPGAKHFGRGELDRGQHNEIRVVTFITGAAMLVKCRLFLDIGLLDDCFFFGVEDYDFCQRAIIAKYSLMYIPEAIIWHKVGVSRKHIHDFIWYYRGYKSNIIYMKRKLPLLIWPFWFFLYALYVLIIYPYRMTKQHIFMDKRFYRKIALKALKEGFFDTSVSRADIEKVQNMLKHSNREGI